MTNDFQPLYEPEDKETFDVWELKTSEPVVVEDIDPNEELQKECERLREEAKKLGFEEGMQQAASELHKMRQDLLAWLEILQKPVLLLDEHLSYELVQTIAWICEHCIGIELSIHPEKLLTLLEEIKKELPSLQENKQLLMNPQDVEWLLNELDEKQSSELNNILIADDNLRRGDFYLKSAYSELDGRIKTRLEEILKKYLLEDNGSEGKKDKDLQ
ncbi:FliH/SctL family protein [Legionella jordanis]|uniref:Flagellar assembly protein FliH n=1 Tax=Legionella jordanis TaxID=456 RepID=A0A0W0V8P6_9GAMM|nr:FliH/SctL family protein [Legionella jordanis]KTD16466.1 polar flagellar assembly protein FliH [Legionella jordanis]RMX03984.1 flagellar assembly protein FliH [Legionella jordanis]RMX15274.1 flagellar assembly protein FliH [Legionella jordanis]VEH12074.1 flagellar assembly protein FliH [Legionella jordanis]HAT8712625.1 flagellar assembly protein FliH [Legionella jordanis]